MIKSKREHLKSDIHTFNFYKQVRQVTATWTRHYSLVQIFSSVKMMKPSTCLPHN